MERYHKKKMDVRTMRRKEYTVPEFDIFWRILKEDEKIILNHVFFGDERK